jgi:chromosomal replication initiator protein
MRYGNADVLLLDDIDCLQCSVLHQEAILCLIKHFIAEGKKIAATSEVPLERLVDLNSVAKVLLDYASCAYFNEPDYLTKQAILFMVAEREGITCPVEIIYALAKKMAKSSRELEGLISKLGSFCFEE